MMKRLTTNINIEASPETVWKTLMDFNSYPEWNPFIRSIEGEKYVGGRLKATLHPPEGKAMIFKPTVLRADENKEFRWLGHLFIKGLFDGEHVFKIEKGDNNSINFIHEELFRGLLVPLFSRMIDTKIKNGFNAMNAALKERAEKEKQ